MKHNYYSTLVSAMLTVISMLMSLLPATSVARERSVDDMIAIAHQTLTSTTTHRAHAISAQRPMRVLSMHKSLAVVGFDEGAFCLVARDDAHQPLLGYSEDPYELAQQNPNFRALVQYLDAQVDYCAQQGIPFAPKRVVGKHAEGYGPLLHCTYNQGYPYNLHTPVWNGQHTLTGCVATAASMLMQYWHEHFGLPLTTHGRKAYTFTFGEDDAKNRNLLSYNYSERPIDVDNLLADYEGGKGNYHQLQAVAELHAAMGVAACMGYGLSGSGAYNDVTCYSIDWFVDGLRHRNVLQYGDMNTDAIKQKVCDELDEDRPVFFSGHTEDSGHSFVIDGYDNTGLFHINLGWGGSGWYSAADDMAGFHLSQTLDFIYQSDEKKIFNSTPVEELQGKFLTTDFDHPVTGEFQDSTWYVLWNVGRGLVPYSTQESPTDTRRFMDMSPYMPVADSADQAAPLVFRFIPTSNGNSKRRHIQSGNGDFIGLLLSNGSSNQNPKSRMGAPYFTFGEIEPGYWWFRDKNGTTLNSPGVGSRLCGWGAQQPTDTVANDSWRILPVIIDDVRPVSPRAALFDSTHVYQIKLVGTENYLYLGYGQMKPVVASESHTIENTYLTLRFDGFGWHISDAAGHDLGLKSGTQQCANNDSYRWLFEPTDQPDVFRISKGDGYLGARTVRNNAEVIHSYKATDNNVLWQVIDITPEPDAIQNVEAQLQQPRTGAYTPAGVRTNMKKPGLYIVNGRKVLVK